MTAPRRGPSRTSSGKRPARALALRPAAAAIADALEFHHITDDVRRNRVLTEWEDLVGPRIAARTRPYGISDRALIIDVVSSAWLQELTLLKGQLLPNLLARVGEPRLFDDLRFKLAGRTGARPEPPRRRPPKVDAPPPERTPATGLARENIVREVEAVDDLELRELIARVRIQNGT
jgi:predicted nucleic acid-binding Zn ribbon protein